MLKNSQHIPQASAALFLLLLSACSNLPPKDSASRVAYDSCITNADLLREATGSQNQEAIKKIREYCICQSEVYWELEQKQGWSMAFNKETEKKIFAKCATDEMRKKEERRIAEIKRREQARQRFIDNIENLYR